MCAAAGVTSQNIPVSFSRRNLKKKKKRSDGAKRISQCI